MKVTLETVESMMQIFFNAMKNAEKGFPGKASGGEKLEFALNSIRADLREAGDLLKGHQNIDWLSAAADSSELRIKAEGVVRALLGLHGFLKEFEAHVVPDPKVVN